MKIKKIKSTHSGIISAILLVAPFCQLHVAGLQIHLPSHPQVIIATILLVTLLLLIKKNKHQIIPKYTTLFMIAFSSIFILSLLISDFKYLTLSRSLIIISTSTITFFIGYKIHNTEKFMYGFSISTTCICAISVFYSILGIAYSQNYISPNSDEFINISIGGVEFIQDIANRSFVFDDEKLHVQRFAGILPNPNGLGLLSAVAFILSYNKLTTREAKIFIRTISILGLILSFSRMGLLLFSISLIYINLRQNSIRKIFSATCVLFVSIFIIFIASSGTNNSITSMGIVSPLNHEIFNLGERRDLMTAAWQAFSDNWLFGVGFGVAAEHLFAEEANIQAVHSVLMNSLVETGVIGTLLLITLWLFPVFNTNDKEPKADNPRDISQVVSAIFLGLFVAEAFDLSVTRFHYIHLIFFMLLGVWSSAQRTKVGTAEQHAQGSQPPKLL